MVFLIIGLVLFFGAHFYTTFRSRDAVHDIKHRMGAGPYMGLYSVVALIGLVLIVYGFDAARPSTVLWSPPVWTRHLNMLLTLPALILLVAAYTPTGHIKKAVRHPMLAGVKLWALGHLLANGELNSLLLFGSFLAYGVIDRIALKKRGDNGPPKSVPAKGLGDVMAVVIGVGAWVAIAFWLHPILFGVAVIT